jgi:large subunit ribosomal protein L4
MASQSLKYDIYSPQGDKLSQTDLNPAIFAVEVNPTLIHQAVVTQLANARKVLAHTKDRSEVSGGGRKPWRQKGTGRARHGSIRSPLWIGGGVTFGPTKHRNFAKKINKKMKRKALFMALSDRVKEGQMVILDKLEIKGAKTKEFVELVKTLKDILKLQPIKTKKKQTDNPTETDQATKKFDIKDYKISILLITAKDTSLAVRVARNVPGVKVLNANSLNIVDILAHKNLLITQDSLKVLEETYLS